MRAVFLYKCLGVEFTKGGCVIMSNKPYEFDEIANGPFFPIYSVIAEQIRDKTGIQDGVCLDIGSGGGHLGLSFALQTGVDVILLDKVEEALEIAKKRIVEWELQERAITLLGNVQQLPVESESIDLCMSRGSVWFWENQREAFKEIYRVLKVGGMAYIGGGFGNQKLRDEVDKKMKMIDSQWPKNRQQFVEGNNVTHFSKLMEEIDVPFFEVTEDEKGIWVFFKKEAR